MRHALFALFAAGVLAVLSGCTTDPSCQRSWGRSELGAAACRCGRADCPRCGRGCGQQAADPGPATGAITYPYYTLHGPRDFLQRTPSPLGP